MAAERTSLRRVAAAVVNGSDPSAALSLAAEEVAALMGVEQGFVFRFEGDRVIVAGVDGIERSPIGAVHGMLEEGVLPAVVPHAGARPRRGSPAAAGARELGSVLDRADLLLGRAVGSAPWLAPEEARALVAVRLARFASALPGVSPELCRFLADRLNDGFVPAVPRDGVGSAGEVIPLAHAFQTILGVGRVLTPGGGVQDAAAALAARGVAPYSPRAKEGIALLAGSPGVTGLAVVRRVQSARLARLLLLGAACSADAAGMPAAPLSPAAGRASADPLLADVLVRFGDCSTARVRAAPPRGRCRSASRRGSRPTSSAPWSGSARTSTGRSPRATTRPRWPAARS